VGRLRRSSGCSSLTATAGRMRPGWISGLLPSRPSQRPASPNHLPRNQEPPRRPTLLTISFGGYVVVEVRGADSLN
jgi:hypothetical protein